MPRGGFREGAGRPPTHRRITLDAEAAQELGALLRHRQQACPEARWTAAALVRYLITEAFAREVRSASDQPSPPR